MVFFRIPWGCVNVSELGVPTGAAESLLPLHQTNEPLSDAVPSFSSAVGGRKQNWNLDRMEFLRAGTRRIYYSARSRAYKKIIFCLQFCSINLTLLQEVCASKGWGVPGGAVTVRVLQKHLFGVRDRVSLASDGRTPHFLAVGETLSSFWLTGVPQLKELLLDEKRIHFLLHIYPSVIKYHVPAPGRRVLFWV